MNSFITKPVVIQGESTLGFIRSLMHPDSRYMQLRNAVFDEIDRNINIQRDGMDMNVDIQDLDLSFIDSRTDA